MYSRCVTGSVYYLELCQRRRTQISARWGRWALDAIGRRSGKEVDRRQQCFLSGRSPEPLTNWAGQEGLVTLKHTEML
jgi:hypothetical protein